MLGSPCLIQRTLLRAAQAASLSALALLVMSGAALAGHLNPAGTDSVDGGEIRYEDNTKYDGARKRAIKAWNAVGRINIAPDNASHVCDLEIMDQAFPVKRSFWALWEY